MIKESPLVSSPTPGAKSVSPCVLTVTSVPSGKTVSRCPSIRTVFFPVPSRLATTLPSLSIKTSSAPAFFNSFEKAFALIDSLNGGAGISVR